VAVLGSPRARARARSGAWSVREEGPISPQLFCSGQRGSGSELFLDYEHEDEDEHDFLTSGFTLSQRLTPARLTAAAPTSRP